MDEMKLEPCPFCLDGGAPDTIERLSGPDEVPHQCWFVSCMVCETDGPPASTADEAERRWNRRQPQSAEWVPWKEGDPLPPAGLYVTTVKGNPRYTSHSHTRCFENHCVIAYIPQRLPDPYTDAQGKRLPEREECEK